MLRRYYLPLLVSACATQPTYTVLDTGKADGAVSFALAANQGETLQFDGDDTAVAFTIDCSPPSNPDEIGLVFNVDAPTLGIKASKDPDRASFYRWSGTAKNGTHVITLNGVQGTGTCKASLQKVTATCSEGMIFRSPNANHVHLSVGSQSPGVEAFAASGHHWGAWAEWEKEYTKPVKQGFYLHNLEHGGLVLSYKCSSASQSTACQDARDDLAALMKQFGEVRVILTPDPTQPEMYAARGWRWGYSAPCFDKQTMLAFMNDRFRQGREDTDAQPPLPYDPTTTTVPCENLMSAPDSCP